MKKGKCLISLQQGIFTGGDPNKIKKQNELIEKICNIKVLNLKLPLDNWNDTFNYVKNKLLIYSKKYDIYIIGRSSGGYLGKILFDTYPNLIKKIIYLCPVFNPRKRQEIHTQYQKPQDYYFRFNKEIPSTNTFNPKNEYIYIAINDKKVPLECYTNLQKKYFKKTNYKTHRGLCFTTNIQFIKEICKILEN